LDCSFVSFSPQQTLVELFLTPVVVAVEKWKALCAFQAQRLFHGSIRLRSSALDDADSLCRWSGGKMSFTGFTDTYKQSRNVRLI
jgi:hypothetical protein